jgi:hypothetical protein
MRPRTLGSSMVRTRCNGECRSRGSKDWPLAEQLVARTRSAWEECCKYARVLEQVTISIPPRPRNRAASFLQELCTAFYRTASADHGCGPNARAARARPISSLWLSCSAMLLGRRQFVLVLCLGLVVNRHPQKAAANIRTSRERGFYTAALGRFRGAHICRHCCTLV